MSVKVMGLVWDLQIARDIKFVLLAYADHADHEGYNIYPSIKTVAKKTGYEERSIQRITRKLEESGLLIPMGGQAGGRGVTPNWRIPLKNDKITPFTKGDKLSSKRVTNNTRKGDTAMSPEPSLTVIKPIEEEGENSGAIFRAYESEIGSITPMISEELQELEHEHPTEWIIAAMRVASINGKRSLGYFKAILKRWKVDGYGTELKAQKRANGKDPLAGIREFLEEIGDGKPN